MQTLINIKTRYKYSIIMDTEERIDCRSYDYQKYYIKAWHKKNRAKIRKRLQQKVYCGCGSVITLSSLYNHNNTRKHNEYLTKITPLNVSI
jgi:hypothetical protein